MRKMLLSFIQSELEATSISLLLPETLAKSPTKASTAATLICFSQLVSE